MAHPIRPVVGLFAVALGSFVSAADEAPFYPDRSKLMIVRDAAGKDRPVKTLEDWAARRAHVIANMEKVMGPLPAADAALPLDLQVHAEADLGTVVRKTISYVPEKGDRVAAYLFVPKGIEGKRPAVLCLHPTNRLIGKGVAAGLGPLPNRGYAQELAERGYVTLAPDYPNSGDHKFDVYNKGYASATMKAIVDNRRGIDLLQSLPEVDAANIGCVGHSLGGHNTLFTAAFEPRIKALVSCCGFTAFSRYKGGNLNGWSHDGYMPRIKSVYNADPAKLPFEFHEVVGAIAPRAFLAVAPIEDDNFDLQGVKEVMASAADVYKLFGASDNLKAVYPDAKHDFPIESRTAAYTFFDRHLKPRREPVPVDKMKTKTPAEEKATFHLAPGFRIDVVAFEPDVIDPVSMAFDEHGRLYVCEMPSYPNGGLGEGDINTGRVRLLSDPGPDGRFRKSTVFADKLTFPTSVMPYGKGVLIASVPNIFYAVDKDGDGVADELKVLYTGFGRRNIQAMLNHLQWGIDNLVHGAGAGNGGEITSPHRLDMPAVVLRGRNFRFDPENLRSFEPTSGGGQYALTSDDWGHWFTNTNSQHIRQIVLPDHYLRRNPQLAVSAVLTDIADHGSAARIYRSSPDEAWRVERTTMRAGGADSKRFSATELVPSGFTTSACGLLVYRGGLMGKGYEGAVFGCDPANNLLHRDVLVGDGPVLIAGRHDFECEFLTSEDNFFRPVDLTVGPDGALYVCDFYRGVIETPLSLPEFIKQKYPLESWKCGRIWRIAPAASAPGTPVALPGSATTDALVQMLAHPNAWMRLAAQRLLVTGGKKDAVPAIKELARTTKSAAGLLHALWTLEGLGAGDAELIEPTLRSPVPGLRFAGLRLAERHFKNAPKLAEAALALANDPVADVRFQAAFSLGELDDPRAGEALATIARRDAGNPWIQTAVLSSASVSAPKILAKLLADARAGKPDAALLARMAVLVGAGVSEKETVIALAAAVDGEGSQAWRLAVLEGIGQGLRQSRRSLAKLLDKPPATLVAAAPRLTALFTQAIKSASDETASAPDRLAAVRLLSHAPFKLAGEPLAALLAPQVPQEMQTAAVAALSANDDPGVAPKLLAGWDGYTPNLRREVLEALFARTDRLDHLLTALEKGDVAVGHLEPARRSQLTAHADPKIRARAGKLPAGVSEDRKKIIVEMKPALDLASDPAAGKLVFKKHCSVCHRLQGEGQEVGADLSAALKNKTSEILINDILDPSREVDQRFLNYLVQTRDGRLLTGVLAAETANSVTLRRAQRAEDTILRGEIELMKATTQSIMPEGFEKHLTKQELADLIRYLLSTRDN